MRIAVIIITLALAAPALAQDQVILSGSFDRDGGFVSPRGQRAPLAPRGTWGPGMDLPPAAIEALPGFRAQVLFERKDGLLRPLRLHSPRVQEALVEVVSASRVDVNGVAHVPDGRL